MLVLGLFIPLLQAILSGSLSSELLSGDSSAEDTACSKLLRVLWVRCHFSDLASNSAIFLAACLTYRAISHVDSPLECPFQCTSYCNPCIGWMRLPLMACTSKSCFSYCLAASSSRALAASSRSFWASCSTSFERDGHPFIVARYY